MPLIKVPPTALTPNFPFKTFKSAFLCKIFHIKYIEMFFFHFGVLSETFFCAKTTSTMAQSTFNYESPYTL